MDNLLAMIAEARESGFSLRQDTSGPRHGTKMEKELLEINERCNDIRCRLEQLFPEEFNDN